MQPGATGRTNPEVDFQLPRVSVIVVFARNASFTPGGTQIALWHRRVPPIIGEVWLPQPGGYYASTLWLC
jgi:hypothetical protein